MIIISEYFGIDNSTSGWQRDHCGMTIFKTLAEAKTVISKMTAIITLVVPDR